MNGNIGCVGLVALVLFIGLLALRTRKSNKEVGRFYNRYSLVLANDAPPIVREAIGAAANPSCRQGNLNIASSSEVPFYWWEWFVISMYYAGNAPHNSTTCFLAISFPPNVVSEEFERKAIQAKEANKGFLQKLKSAFGINTQTPIRVEKLADDSFLICWQIVQREKILEDKMVWLKNNVSISSKKIMQPVFYKHDNYAMLRQKFNSAWTNLHLELHHSGPKLDHEDRDEFDDDANYADPTSPNEVVFTLTDETITETAIRLFEENFGGTVFILRQDVSIERGESLAYCNNPFRLPLNEFTYGEFKRRFTERWTNLSIEIYDTSPHDDGLWQNSRELADDFEMKNLNNADKSYLHDYAYISTWGDSLKNVQVAAAIKNNKLGINCEGNLRNMQLKKFQAAEKV